MSENADFISLLTIAALAAMCPLLANRIPRKIIPETVFLLILGAAFGPYGAIPLIQLDTTVSFLSELGCAFLFLLAGYEIDPDTLTGHQGKRGLTTWIVTFAIAAVAVIVVRGGGIGETESWALAIMLTTTAIGTLMPILTERGLLGTPIGNSVLSYGTWGELCPIIAIALLLSSRAAWQTLAILGGLALLCVFLGWRGSHEKKHYTAFYRILQSKANTTSQTFMRFTIFMLILLVTISALFGLDIVLGAFAAGFVLRYIVPEGNKTLETKLDGMGYGLFIPLFFICSGAKIDVTVVAAQPMTLVLFIVALLLIRSVPVFVAMRTDQQNRALSTRACASVAVYCATALPLLVAASNVAVNAGAMSQSLASTLVAAGAVTVFLMPLLAQLAYHAADASEVGEFDVPDDTALTGGETTGSAADRADGAPAGLAAAGAASMAVGDASDGRAASVAADERAHGPVSALQHQDASQATGKRAAVSSAGDGAQPVDTAAPDSTVAAPLASEEAAPGPYPGDAHGTAAGTHPQSTAGYAGADAASSGSQSMEDAAAAGDTGVPDSDSQSPAAQNGAATDGHRTPDHPFARPMSGRGIDPRRIAGYAAVHHNPIVFRYLVEHMVSSGVDSHDIARFIAAQHGAPNDEDRINLIASRIDQFRARIARERGRQ